MPVHAVWTTLGLRSTYDCALSHQLSHPSQIEFIGSIELVYGSEHEFVSLERELQAPGALTQPTTTFPFDFSAVEKAHESYNGMNVTLRYFLRVTVSRYLAPNITDELNIWVRSPAVPASAVTDFNPIKMEVTCSLAHFDFKIALTTSKVGIEDCLHIEFEYNKTKYHLKDVVIGKIYFLLVRLKIKHMELEVRRRESTGTGSDLYNESETITKFEIMDGAPVRGECVPVRLFLSSFDLTPTYRNVNNKFR